MCLGPKWASSYYLFFLTGTTTPTNVYQNGNLTTAFPTTGKVTADSYGRFPPIYLDTSVTYRVRFFNSSNVQQWQVDSYTAPLSTVGTSALSPYGMNIATTGEVTIPAPNTGGSGVSLTVNAGRLGSAALKVIGTLAGNSALIVNNSATTGAQTATFQANNKPGTPPTSYIVIAAAVPSGGTYTGGTLTSAFTGTTASNYTVQLSTGQDIFGATFTNGITTFTTPSTIIIGIPNTTLNVTTPVTPAGWLPITCDGVQCYAPIWHGNSFTPYAANPSALGETISGVSVTFGGNGVTTVAGGTAIPGNWFAPVAAGIGAGYYINITRTGGTTGVNFSAAQGAWTNIGAGGLTITSSPSGAVNGTYQLSNSSGGSPIVTSGTITLGVFAVTHTYTTGTEITETVPTGASFLEIIADGGGGSGGDSGATGAGGGGGGSGEAHSVGIAVSGGQTLTYTVGKGGAGAGTSFTPGQNGTASTVTGNGSLSSVSLTANGGGLGDQIGNPGAGGTASGGNSANITGSTGGVGSGLAAGGNAASGATGGTFSTPPGTPGAGSGGAHNTATFAGGGGQIVFKYT